MSQTTTLDERVPDGDMGPYSDRVVVWRWTVPPDLFSADDKMYGDICDEYVVVGADNPTGLMIIGRYGQRWVANTSGRAVVAELLRRFAGPAIVEKTP